MCDFCFNVTATTQIYTYEHTLSLNDALPIDLCAESDDADGERHLAGGGRLVERLVGLGIAVDGMAAEHAEQRADRPAQREAGGAADDLSPDAHAQMLTLRTGSFRNPRTRH